MRFLRILGGTALAILMMGNAAKAGPWFGTVLRAPVNATLKLEPPPPPPVPTDYTGHITRFETSSTDQTGEGECRATIASDTNDGHGFVADFHAIPNIREEPFVLNFLLQQGAICHAAQQAYLTGQRVSVLGIMGTNVTNVVNQSGLTVLPVQRFATLSNDVPSVMTHAPEQANVCNQIGCQAQGLVSMVSYPLGQFPVMCTATIKVGSPDATGQYPVAIARIEAMTRKQWPLVLYDMTLLQARLEACQLLEEAQQAQRPVTLLGYGQQGGNSMAAISVTVEDPNTLNLAPM